MSDREYTIYCGNLSERVTEELLFELFLQAGPVEDVHIPAVNGKRRSYGFVVFKHECSVPYAEKLMSNTDLFGRKLDVRVRHSGMMDATPPYTPTVRDRLGPRVDPISLRGLGNDYRKRQMDEDMMPGHVKKRYSPPSTAPSAALIKQLEIAQQMMLTPLNNTFGLMATYQSQLMLGLNGSEWGIPTVSDEQNRTDRNWSGNRSSGHYDRNRNNWDRQEFGRRNHHFDHRDNRRNYNDRKHHSRSDSGHDRKYNTN